MVLLRSEEPGRGEPVPAPRLLALARLWYGGRLDPAWRPRRREESQRLLSASGLRGEFWNLPA
jgi:hypothetical protein